MRSTGTIKFFSEAKGFGFIALESGEKDIFLHQSAIQGEGGALNEGDRVEFDVGEGEKGPRAENVVKL